MSKESIHRSPDRPSDPTLFELPPSEISAPPEPQAPPSGKPRVRSANRSQREFRNVCLEELLPDDHPARIVWAYVESLDLTPLYQGIEAIEREAGRPATDPKILMALWLYATIDGVGSARRLGQLCEYHAAYQWICGGVSTNYHTLADFRTAHGKFLDQLLTHSVATLMAEGLVEMKRVAQDGIRVRANAGAASFRRRATLEESLAEATQQVETLKAELASDPGSATRREKAARQRAAREKADRIAKALKQLPELEAKKKEEEKEKARVSTTDPDARVMKMADGGYRPAFNAQFATDTQTQIIVGADLVNSGGDRGRMAPMVEDIQERFGKAPEEYLVDGGFAKKEDIDTVSAPPMGSTVYAPVQTPKQSKDGTQRGAHEPRPDDSPAVAAWRARMGTEEAKKIYKDRAATAECVNAIARNRGLRQFLVRSLEKTRTVLLWFALAHNLVRAVALRAAVARASI